MYKKPFSATPLLSDSDLAEVISLLSRDELIAIPTETVYGLAGNGFSVKAVQKIFDAKGRPAKNPLILHIGSLEQLPSLLLAPSPLLHVLAEHFWPGPLTLVDLKTSLVPSLASAGLDTVAVRMPSHPCALQILQAIDFPLAAPSANLSGRPSPTSVQHVIEDFGTTIPLIDGGNCSWGIESTVIGLFGDTPFYLRPGAIPRESIEQVLGMTLQSPIGPARAPGMLYRHYAPKAAIVVATTEAEWQELLRNPEAYLVDAPTPQTLYAHFRRADQEGFSKIGLFLRKELLRNEALMDRVRKAASGQISSLLEQV